MRESLWMAFHWQGVVTNHIPFRMGLVPRQPFYFWSWVGMGVKWEEELLEFISLNSLPPITAQKMEDGTRGNQEAEPLEVVDSYRTLLPSISQSPHHCVSQAVPTVNVKWLNSMASLSVHPSEILSGLLRLRTLLALLDRRTKGVLSRGLR